MTGFQRASGILLHPTALPGSYGIGTFGTQAISFLDWLQSAGQTYWQICPLVPTGYGNSPYQGLCAFAGNPNLIDVEELVSFRLLEPEELDPLKQLPESYVNFSLLIPEKKKLLHLAWSRYSAGKGPKQLTLELEAFRIAQSQWLEDFCTFMALKNQNGEHSWDTWAKEMKLREKKSLDSLTIETANEVQYHLFVQFLFFHQWQNIKSEAQSRAIKIIGDIPIFVAFDSSDCWANPRLFQLDANLLPTNIAGVPPDYFSSTGQLWGNPLYDWDKMAEDEYSWWLSLLKNKLEQYDVLRIDHFRGFCAYWSVPFGETTAVNGKWMPAPGRALFSLAREKLGELPIIAEDLGFITEEVVELIEACGFPRMKILQFAFNASEENNYLPHNYDKNSVVYTGTHDNDTIAGWFEIAPECDRKKVIDYLNLGETTDAKTVAGAMLRAAMASVANFAIFPMQDVLGLDNQARFNTPGTLGDNWMWRAPETSFSDERAEYLRKLCEIYGRLNYSRDTKEENSGADY